MRKSRVFSCLGAMRNGPARTKEQWVSALLRLTTKCRRSHSVCGCRCLLRFRSASEVPVGKPFTTPELRSSKKLRTAIDDGDCVGSGMSGNAPVHLCRTIVGGHDGKEN